MTTRPAFAASLCAAVLALAAPPAPAFIKIDTPFAAVYDQSTEVYVGKVTAIDAEKNRVTVTVTKVLRQDKKDTTAEPPKDPVALQFDEPKELLKQLEVGSPVVAFVAGKAMLVHCADAWLTADRPAERVWRVTGRHAVTSAFPGRTVALVDAVQSLPGGKRIGGKNRDSLTAKQLAERGNPVLDFFEHSNWGASYSLGKLGVKGTHMIAADVDGDKNPDVLIVTGSGMRLFRGTGAGKPVEEVTKAWGLDGVKATRAAFGDADGDGKPDLLLDGALWLNSGKAFAPAKPALAWTGKEPPLAVGLFDVTGDKHPDAVVLSATGVLDVFENPGAAGGEWKAAKPRQLWTGGDAPIAAHFGEWGDDGKPHALVVTANDITRYALTGTAAPADYARLTGLKRESRYFPIKDHTASVAIDLNGGDGRLDLVLFTKTGKPRDIVLMNRGYGAFWPNNEAGRPKALGGKNAFPVALAAADVYADGSRELLLLTATGELVQLDSPPYKNGKPAP